MIDKIAFTSSVTRNGTFIREFNIEREKSHTQKWYYDSNAFANALIYLYNDRNNDVYTIKRNSNKFLNYSLYKNQELVDRGSNATLMLRNYVERRSNKEFKLKMHGAYASRGFIEISNDLDNIRNHILSFNVSQAIQDINKLQYEIADYYDKNQKDIYEVIDTKYNLLDKIIKKEEKINVIA